MSTWPKLSETAPKAESLRSCQFCGRVNLSVSVWLECDDQDKETPTALVVCERCVERHITPHARLYRRLENNRPMPGAMATCEDCAYRQHLTCRSPLLKSNGGDGLPVTFPEPSAAFVDGVRDGRRTGWVEKFFHSPPTCEGRVARENDQPASAE